MRVRCGLLVSAIAAAPLVAQVASQDAGSPSAARVARAVRVESGPVIDGRLDESLWQLAPAIRDFVQHEPVEGAPPSEPTEVRIVYDGEALYVGAWLYDRQTASLVLGEARRDVDLRDMDAFIIVLDTYLDRQNAFVFGTSPSGVEYDGQVTREGEGGLPGVAGNVRPQRGGGSSSGGYVNLNWDGNWQVATSVDSAGWYAEFRIPFSTLRYPRPGAQRWGLNFARRIRRRNEEIFWSPVPRQFTVFRVSLAGILEGVEIQSRNPIALIPYAMTSAVRYYAPRRETDWSGEFGGDLKVSLTPSLVLDLTYNTDFAQVEVDEQQVNLTRFNLFFPEKRPFFLENAGNFAVGTPQAVELFFSRRIGVGPGGSLVPIQGGARLNGRAGGVTLGVLDIQTDEVTAPDGSIAVAAANYGVMRVLRQFPNRSRLGAIFASRVNTDSTGDYNLTYGVDGQLGVGQALVLDGYLARTETPGRLGGEHAFALQGSYNTRAWSMGASYREVAEDFNPEVGFLERAAYRFVSLRVLRRVRPSASWIRELRPHVTYREYFDLGGFSETRLIHIDSHFEFPNGTFFQLPAINFTREGLKRPFEVSRGVVVPPGTYDNAEWGFAYNTNLSAPVSVSGRIDIGGFYTGHRKGGSATLTGRLGDRFLTQLRATFYDVDLPEGSFQTAVIGAKISYAFTPRIYLQSLLQYNDQSDQYSGNIRLGWLSAAGTGLFVVYNERRSTADRWRPLEQAVVVKFTRQLLIGG
jgi:hypothetical protein